MSRRQFCCIRNILYLVHIGQNVTVLCWLINIVLNSESEAQTLHKVWDKWDCCVHCAYHSHYERPEGSNAELHIHIGSMSSLFEPILHEVQLHSSCENKTKPNCYILCFIVLKLIAVFGGGSVSYLTRSSYSQLRPVKCFGQAQKLPRMQVPPFLQQFRLCVAPSLK